MSVYMVYYMLILHTRDILIVFMTLFTNNKYSTYIKINCI